MTVRDVIELRRQGRTEEAYDAIRRIYASDKGESASATMFWTAVDVLKKRTDEGRLDEARKILMALERLASGVSDGNGSMRHAMHSCHALLEKAEARPRQPGHLQLGSWGEDLAAAYLREKGYIILERDWHSGHRDIDIVAKDSDCVVFVEVKTRRGREFGEPEMAVDYRKQRNLRLAIHHYLKYRRIDSPWRFDVITIIGAVNCPEPEINHIVDFAIN